MAHATIGEGAVRSERTTEERAALTREVLLSPIESTDQAIATRVGLRRETVRKIRYGKVNADVATDLPRLEPGALSRRCNQCKFFLVENYRKRDDDSRKPVCDLGIEESKLIAYARGCGAFWPAETETAETEAAETDTAETDTAETHAN